MYKVGSGSEAECLSCWMESLNCGFIKAEFGKDSDTHLLSCSGPGRSLTFLRRTSTNETRTSITLSVCNFYGMVNNMISVEIMKNNTRLGEYLVQKALPVVKYDTVHLDNGFGR